jgi:hypothetical protein
MAIKSQYEKEKAGHVLIIHHSGRSYHGTTDY